MLSWMDAASGVLGVRVIMCECHELYKEQWSREWKGLGRWRGGVVMVDVQAGGAHHTQIDIAPLLDDVGSFRIPDRCPPDRAPPRRAALRSRRGSSDAPSPGQDLEGRDKGAKSTGRPCHMSLLPHAPELRLAECSSNRQCNRFSKGRSMDLRGNSSSPLTQQALAAPSPGMATCGAARARRGRRAHRPAA